MLGQGFPLSLLLEESEKKREKGRERESVGESEGETDEAKEGRK